MGLRAVQPATHLIAVGSESMTTPSEDYRTIPLTQGQVALVDATDYEWLLQWNWYALRDGRTFYAVRNGKYKNGKRERSTHMHRFILGLEPGDKGEVDHINGNGCDNRRSNLRICAHRENSRNMRLRVDSKSGFKGVNYFKPQNRWMARIGVGNKRVFLGYYDTPEDAHVAYCAAAKEYHREFAWIGNK